MMAVYVNIAATYSDDAWARASLMSDGRTIGGILGDSEFSIAAAQAATINHDFEVYRLREMVAHDEAALLRSKGRAHRSVRAGYARNLRWSRRALKAAVAAAELAVKDAL